MGRHFAPHGALAASIIARVDFGAHDAAHDLGHLVRVWRNAVAIVDDDGMGVDGRLLAAATVLHDCVHVEKDDPRRPLASRMAADEARAVLSAMGWLAADVEAVAHAVEAHSFSARVEPRSDLARVLQDADRLDALGAVGVARCFSVSGRLGRLPYDIDDPWALGREPDEVRWTVDHFGVKLLRLAETFRTASGRAEAERRTATMRAFLDDLAREAGLEPLPSPGSPLTYP